MRRRLKIARESVIKSNLDYMVSIEPISGMKTRHDTENSNFIIYRELKS